MLDADATGILISSDSHVFEKSDLWASNLPLRLRDKLAPMGDTGLHAHPGGNDPGARVREMAQDGVAGEVLYTTLGMKLFSLEDAELQEACFGIYNDWLIDYCRAAPDRLVGVAMIPTFDIAHALSELTRCRKAGLRGAQIWELPPPSLSFASDHYDSLWAAAQELQIPVSLHIITGFDPTGGIWTSVGKTGALRYAVNIKLERVLDSLFNLIFTGVLERFPGLKLVLVEYEMGWIRWILQQWDRYAKIYQKRHPMGLKLLPSEYFRRQVFVTFFNDPVGARQLEWGAEDNFMWSSDFPHPNSTWPHSRTIIAEQLGYLPPETQRRLVCDNVAKLYGIEIPPPIAAA